jgi:hypothetical protein
MISICFYVLGGFFVYMVCLLAFTNIPQGWALKFTIMIGFSVPALIFLFIGAATCHFQNWKSSIGIALLSGVGFNLLLVITFICLLLTPEFAQFFPDNKLALFNDYFSGASVMLVLSGLGGLLLKIGMRNIAEQGASPDGDMTDAASPLVKKGGT